ncbi:hypothetical protein [Beijerinckia sp. L45]|uniref:hypothetical protein n=1 Tax=Beijerinckia sp. L45 TaxID=1641855 RepID=UPI00131B7F0C|nr:hypothetical protein [Beijerinckia sp. L45]
MMRFGKTAATLTVVAALASVVLPAQAATKHGVHHKTLAQIKGGHMSLRFASPSMGTRAHGRHGTGMTTLVGDRESGLGFYNLPAQYRAGARLARSHQGDAIRYAIGSEMGNGYYYGVGGEDAGESHHHAMFNPVDGYGTPFFAGYYGPAGDPDDDRGPFGNPYE